MSEKSYWVLLIALFTGFALIIWFGLIPYGFVEYNVGVNLFTSSVFMVLTIVFLAWLISFQERRRWKKVESIVLKEIGGVAEHLFRSTVLYYKGWIEDFWLFDRDLPNVHEAFLNRLTKLIKKEMPLEKTNIQLLSSHNELLNMHFLQFRRELSEIEAKYFKFLQPDVVLSVIKMQNWITGLEYSIQTYTYIGKIAELISKKVAKKEKKIEGPSIEQLENMISAFFERILGEIQNLNTLGIEIYPNLTKT